MDKQTKAIRELLHPKDYTRALDLRDTSTGGVCVCGCEVFIALISFDEYNDI